MSVDLVAAVNELTVRPSTLEALHRRMLISSSGRRLLRHQPRIHTSTLPIESEYGQLAPNTLGYQYALFLSDEQISPDTRVPVRYIAGVTESFLDHGNTVENFNTTNTPIEPRPSAIVNSLDGSGYYHNERTLESRASKSNKMSRSTKAMDEQAYIIQRYREIHDIVHVLLGCPTTFKGEVAVKWFEYLQTGLEGTLLAGLAGPLRVNGPWAFQDSVSAGSYLVDAKAQPSLPDQIDSKHANQSDWWKTVIPWAIQTGSEAEFLLAVEFETLMRQDIDHVRRSLRIVTAPFI